MIGAVLFHSQLDTRLSKSTPPLLTTSASLEAGALSSPIPISDDNYDKFGMEKLAEMTALSRHSEGCLEISQEWSAAFIVLIMARPPSEEQVEAKEQEMLALRNKIGEAKWCLLYGVEMKEAYLIYQFAIHRSRLKQRRIVPAAV